MSNVKLAIRVRPFTDKEIKAQKDRVPVIDVIDVNTVTITNLKVSLSGAGDSRERVRRYFADYTFDSACASTHPNHATQEKVFDSIGEDVLAVLSKGMSACVLAYGQSATGKTHTMMGTDDEPGFIPRICDALAKEHAIDITVSYLEIYNERVHDLLVCEEPLQCRSLPRRKGNASKDLRVREHPHRGTFVQNLRRVAVQDVSSLQTVVREGTRRRRTAATRRNTTSSRSHALLEIVTPHATLHLADLAGSEKASWEGCGGGRQKEGANINKSLVALSNVISALVSRGAGKGRFVPYRDSALTWLLKDCFTGGANTFIIATVSPSVSCYGESASTLRWAERARQLPLPVRTLASVAGKSTLQAQLDSLLDELARHHITYVPEKGKIYFEEKHWDQEKITTVSSETQAKIGNIMNLTRQKNDAQNSESTASSVASESSDVTMDKNVNIENEINEEVDKILGPVLERARSGTDIEVNVPLRHKKRQYRSQEVLSIDKPLQEEKSLGPENGQQNVSSSKQEKVKNLPILYDNQRAEIVASVTDRLYSKMKKKEEAASPKIEAVVDKKIIEPLSELRICTNARQRLIDLSRNTSRNKRRIGIPTYTQTKLSVIRVRDQSTDIQSDLEPYIIKERDSYIFHKHAGTETMPMTPRCKEKAVGPKSGSIYVCDRSTVTDNKQMKKYISTFVMTDEVEKTDFGTQTIIVPPPRRKKRLSPFAKYIRCQNVAKAFGEVCAASPTIRINISQNYTAESESQSSDENVRNAVNTNSTPVPPDLLTNHSSCDIIPMCDEKEIVAFASQAKGFDSECADNYQDGNNHIPRNDFSDSEDYILPKVSVNSKTLSNQEDMNNLILGNNQDIFPYNIQISPYKEREESKRTIKFEDEVNKFYKDQSEQSSKTTSDDPASVPFEDKPNKLKDSYLSSCSCNTDGSKTDSDSFIYKNMNTERQNHVRPKPMNYKINRKYYKQFLGVGNRVDKEFCSQCSLVETAECFRDTDIRIDPQARFLQSRKFFEDKVKQHRYDDSYEELERKVLESCERLYTTANRYNNYFSRRSSLSEVHGTKPTEYLQHLVNLRKEAIKAQTFSENMNVKSVKQENNSEFSY